MNASTHTLELDPAVTWRPVGTRGTVARRPEPAVVGTQDPASACARAAAVPRAKPDRFALGGRDAMELGCFLATLAAIGSLQLGLLALLA